MITFRCEHCRKNVEAPDSAVSKRGKCPYCGLSSYIPAPVKDEEVLDLAPIDEQEERRRDAEIKKLLAQEHDLLAETGGEPTPPLENREDLTKEDLHHLVVNYCLDMSSGNLKRADAHVAELRKFSMLSVEAVNDFISQKALEPALANIPGRVLQVFLTQLRDKVR